MISNLIIFLFGILTGTVIGVTGLYFYAIKRIRRTQKEIEERLTRAYSLDTVIIDTPYDEDSEKMLKSFGEAIEQIFTQSDPTTKPAVYPKIDEED